MHRFLQKLALLAGTAILGTFVTGSAHSEFAARGGYAVKPASGIELPEQIGRSAHTNFQFFVPNAGKAAQQFSHEVAPEQTGGPPFAGYFYETPASLACVYQLVAQQAGCNPNTVTANSVGGARAIAIVDAYHYPTAVQDLQIFSAQFGLPAPTTLNFQVVFAAGKQPQVNYDWNVEEALDIEWAHAMAPNAKIYLVEAAANSYGALLTAVSVANSLLANGNPPGGEVSMSWGGSEFSSETSSNYDGKFTQSGVVYFAAAGDSPGVIWPSASPNVVSAGGTSVSRNPNTGAFQLETTWQSGGGGASVYETRPNYQNGIAAIVLNQRGTPDVAADANPSTGVWIYSQSLPYLGYPSWIPVGGTSVATPVWAGIVNAAKSLASSSPAELSLLYQDQGTTPITMGTCGPNQGYIAGGAWSFCTGLGSPRGEGRK
jgi:kumamolisin